MQYLKKIIMTVLISTLLLCGCGKQEKTASSSTPVITDPFFWEENEIYGFDGTYQGDTLIIPNNCTRFRYATLSEENNTVKHVIFEGDDTLVEDTFNYLTNLESIQLPKNLKVLPGSSFSRCQHLTEIELPAGVTTIGEFAFFSSGIRKLHLGESIKDIGQDAFCDCQNLTEITIDHAESIGDSAFFSCDSVKEIRLPEGLVSIGELSFSDMDSLENIYLPESLTQIDGTALAQTHTVNVYVKKGSYADKAFESGYGNAGGLVKKYY